MQFPQPWLPGEGGEAGSVHGQRTVARTAQGGGSETKQQQVPALLAAVRPTVRRAATRLLDRPPQAAALSGSMRQVQVPLPRQSPMCESQWLTRGQPPDRHCVCHCCIYGCEPPALSLARLGVSFTGRKTRPDPSLLLGGGSPKVFWFLPRAALRLLGRVGGPPGASKVEQPCPEDREMLRAGQ